MIILGVVNWPARCDGDDEIETLLSGLLVRISNQGPPLLIRIGIAQTEVA